MFSFLCCVASIILTPFLGVLAQDPINIALNKPAFSSTAYTDNFIGFVGEASLAVDGDADPVYVNRHCFSSAHDDFTPYWFVDLGDFYKIESVQIFNRGDCCDERLRNLTIEVFDNNPTESAFMETPTECGIVTGGVEAAGNITVVCPSDVIGRYIQITKIPENRVDTLQFCEVEVFGTNFSCPAGFRQVDRYCLLWSCFAASYAEAQTYCRILHTNLAEIGNEHVNNFVINSMPNTTDGRIFWTKPLASDPSDPKTSYGRLGENYGRLDRKYWIGANRLQDGETWYFLNSTVVPFLPFTAQLVPETGVIPNPAMTEKCALIAKNETTNQYEWDSGTCGSDQYFICCGIL